jgi:HD-like signal output (HDOD) protein
MPADVLPLFIERPPRDVAGWAALFSASSLPVLPATAQGLEELREMEDAVDAHMLAEAIGNDPLMTLKLLAHVGQLRQGRDGGDVETVTEALVMLGIPPFFRAFGPQEIPAQRLAGHPRALQGFEDTLRRSHRAARFAIGFAVHRMDHDASLIHEAALLHGFAELLLWLHAPALAQRVRERQEADRTLRSALAQKALLNIELADLQHALMTAWRLPSMLIRIADDHAQSQTPQVRNVMLAIRVARHSAHGWDDAALPDDIADISELLQLSPDATVRLLHEIDTD